MHSQINLACGESWTNDEWQGGAPNPLVHLFIHHQLNHDEQWMNDEWHSLGGGGDGSGSDDDGGGGDGGGDGGGCGGGVYLPAGLYEQDSHHSG